MKKSFNFFGIEVKSSGQNIFWNKIFWQKFLPYQQQSTYQIAQKYSINVNFYQNKLVPRLAEEEILDTVVRKNKTQLMIRHDYLSSKNQVLFQFQGKKLMSIKIYHSAGFLFEVANIISFNLIKTQLFRQLIKYYIEQSLFWCLIQQNKNLSCIHASAVEKNGKAVVFAGLNGVGKSTLAMWLVKNQNCKLISDNYLLIDNQGNAYLSPDIIRFDLTVVNSLALDTKDFFGFGKWIVGSNNWTKRKKIKISKYFYLSRSLIGKINQVAKEKWWSRLLKLQIIAKEQVMFSPISQWDGEDTFFNQTDLPNGEYFNVILGKIESYKKLARKII